MGGSSQTSDYAMKSLIRLLVALAFIFSACGLIAQSLGDVARQNRNAPRPRAKKVVTNDDIPSVDTMRASEEKPGESAENAGPKAANAESAKAGDDIAKRDQDRKKQNDELSDKLARQQEKVQLMEREMKVQQQEFQQKQLQHNSDVNARVNPNAQWAEEESRNRQELDSKQQALNAEREKLSGLQEDARRAGVKTAD